MNGLYRDTKREVFTGLCAGIAKTADLHPWFIRAVVILAVLIVYVVAPPLFLPTAVLGIVAYAVGSFIVKVEPPDLADREESAEADVVDLPHASIKEDPNAGLRSVSESMRQLDARLQVMERYVTSPKYDLDKCFVNIGGA